MKKIAVLLFMLLLLPVSVLANDKNPHFLGEITPITTPTCFSYGSAVYDLDMETVVIEGAETMVL